MLLAVPLLVRHGLVEVFQDVYGSLGPAFYGLRTTVVTLFLCALLRIKRPPGGGGSNGDAASIDKQGETGGDIAT